MKAVVLAAGEGVRLRPLTDNRPKHLLPVACKPILQHLMENLVTCGISEIVLVVGRWKQVIAEALERMMGRSLKISYAIQTGVFGTAHAVGTARNYVEDEPFLVLYGDVYTTASAIQKVIETFRNSPCEAVMAVAPVSTPQFFGIVTVEDGYVKSVVEKPSRKSAVGNLANAGIFVFSPRIFEAIDETTRSERNELEITQSLKILMGRGGKIKVAALEGGSWKDIGRPWDLLEANELALRNIKPSIQGKIEEGARLTGPVIVDEEAVVKSGAYIEGPVIISEGAEIGPNSYIRPFTSLGRNVRIGSGCEVKNSIVMNDTKIPHLSYVGDSVIGEGCNFGAGTIVANLRFDGEPVRMMISGRIVDTGRRKLGAVLGDRVQTGINVSIMPGVKIGSHSTINPGLTIYRDVPPRSKVISSQRPGRV